MLELGDLLNLIRLTELEKISLNSEIESDDEEVRNNAGEVVVQFDELSIKLRKMYEKSRPSDSALPEYEDYIKVILSK